MGIIRFNNMKMHKKLLLSYLIVVLIPILIIGSIFIAQTKSIIMDYINHINEISINQVKANIIYSFNSYIKASDNILTEFKLIEMLTKEYSSSSEYLNSYVDEIMIQLNKLLLIMPDSVKISFYSTNRTIVPDNNVVFFANDEIVEQGWYKDAVEANGSNIISLPYLNIDGETVFSISRVLNTNFYSKKSIVMRIEVPLDKIDNLIKEESKNKSILLLDNKNRIFTLSVFNSPAASYEIGDTFKLTGTISENGQALIDDEIFIITEKQLSGTGVLTGWKIVSVISPDTIMSDINRTVRYILLICLATAGITAIMISLFSYKLTLRLRSLTESMRKIKKEDSLEFFSGYDDRDEIGELSRSFEEMIRRINDLINEVYLTKLKVKDLELEKKEAEINALQSQINPHFLFNTMESISMNLLNKGDLETADIIRSFSKLLRRSIEWGNDTTTLKNELDLVWDYLKIHKFRHKNKFLYDISINRSLQNISVPKFILQPVVENAILHGLELKEDQGILKIYAQSVGDDLEITVEDNGLGMEQDTLENIQSIIENGTDGSFGTGQRIGLLNVHQRLRLYYGEQYGIKISSVLNKGTKVIIMLPAQTGGGDVYVQSADS